LAIAGLLVVVLLCVGGLAALATQVRCIDAAREAARLAARGDAVSATAAVQRIVPARAVLDTRHDGDFVVATVSVELPVLHSITITADAVAAVEPTG